MSGCPPGQPAAQPSKSTPCCRAAAATCPPARSAPWKDRLGLRVLVENLEPTRGGTNVQPGAQPAGLASLRETLLAGLAQTALEEARGRLEPGQRLLDETLHLRTVMEENREPPENQPADQLEMLLRAEFEAWYVEEADLQAVASAALDANPEKGFQPAPGSLQVDFLTPPVMEGDPSAPTRASWTLDARRTLEADWSDDLAIRVILGLGAGEARDLLQDRLAAGRSAANRAYPLLVGDACRSCRFASSW